MNVIVNRLVHTLWVILMVACIEAPPGDALVVTATTPTAGGAVPADQPLRVTFDGYLDPAMPFRLAVTLSSGDLSFDAQVAYDPTGPALVVVPRAPLRPGLGYRLVVLADRVRGLDGRTLQADYTLGFLAQVADPRPPPERVDFERDLAPILAQRCGCHGEEPLAFPPLQPAQLVGRPGQADPTRLLVDPGDPLASGLLLKVLPNYPGVRGLAMPPEGPPLPGSTIRLLVAWIENL